jgi:AraC-like DNA-binding protein
MSTIFIIGIYISFFQFVLLLNKKLKSLSDKILTFWMLVICIHLTSYYLHVHGYWEEYPHLVGLTVPVPFLYGPLLFLYVLYSTRSDSKFSIKDYWHFAPTIISYLYMMPFYFFYTPEEKRLVDSGQINDYSTFSNILVIAFMVSGITYSIYSFRLLKKHQELVEENFSYSDKISLNWLRGFIWCIGLMFVSAVLVLVTRDVIGIDYPFNPEFIYYSILIFAILILGYYGIKHNNIFADNVAVVQTEKIKASYQKSGLREPVANEKYDELLSLMKNQKPYLEPKLSLIKLAQNLDISPNHLSQIINQFDDQNFNDFVNKYRVDEFIEKASTDSHFSFLALALASGFNSKSTFNAVFKKHKGESPSQFLSKQS